MALYLYIVRERRSIHCQPNIYHSYNFNTESLVLALNRVGGPVWMYGQSSLLIIFACWPSNNLTARQLISSDRARRSISMLNLQFAAKARGSLDSITTPFPDSATQSAALIPTVWIRRRVRLCDGGVVDAFPRQERERQGPEVNGGNCGVGSGGWVVSTERT